MLTDQETFRCNPRGKFIAFEGVNGAGKSTLIAHVTQLLSSVDITYTQTREPGATELGKLLRPIILDSKNKDLSDLTELFLFAADRSEHVRKVIQPKLREGTTVICDRFAYSTTAFQGYANGTDLSLVNKINQIAVDNTWPDIVVLLDLDPAVGLARKANADGPAENDSFETQDMEYQNKLREGFLALARSAPEPFIVLDATQPVEGLLEVLKNIFVLD